MKTLLLLLSVVFSANLAAHATPIFDGKSFDGWEGPLEFFRIEDGAIIGGTLECRIPKNQFLSTKRVYGDFELRLKFKVKGEGVNGGIQFRTQRIPHHHEVIGYQADVGGRDYRFWGALYDESRRRKILAGPDLDLLLPLLRLDGWNEYVIRAEGNRIQLWLNGFQTVDYIEEDASVWRNGIIAVQIHSGPPSEMWYKDLIIEEL